MPELVHECGKTVRFPSGTEGKRGKCPHCGGRVLVPGSGEVPLQKTFQLEAPPYWSDYQAYLDDRGPPPRPVVMPANLMLQAEADERWERRADVRPSKFFCPSCKDRINVDAVICTRCGLDFRTGIVMGKNMKLNPKGMNYLKGIPWLEAARQELRHERKADQDKKATAKLRSKAPRAKKRRKF